ncbi:hypothetical protein GY45DRAFT_231970 [Cubamyces sp. BRFM 1775]|nr:hypothetical protein GY45DRAFT_231970 [Cubamyces sp. BRFM 1775]
MYMQLLRTSPTDTRTITKAPDRPSLLDFSCLENDIVCARHNSDCECLTWGRRDGDNLLEARRPYKLASRICISGSIPPGTAPTHGGFPHAPSVRRPVHTHAPAGVAPNQQTAVRQLGPGHTALTAVGRSYADVKTQVARTPGRNEAHRELPPLQLGGRISQSVGQGWIDPRLRAGISASPTYPQAVDRFGRLSTDRRHGLCEAMS